MPAPASDPDHHPSRANGAAEDELDNDDDDRSSGFATDSDAEEYVLSKLSMVPDVPQEHCHIDTSAVLSFEQYPRAVHICEDSSAGCGGKTWEAAQVLSDHLVHRWTIDRAALRGKTIVELGAGTGCVGILAGMLLADAEMQQTESSDASRKKGEVVITDMLFLDLMQKNVELNLSEEEQQFVRVEELKWGTPLSEAVRQQYDIILASDCVYLESAFEPLLQTLNDLCGPNTEALIVSKRRRKADKRFFEKLRKQFNITEIKDDPKYPVFSRQGLSIVSARKKSGR
ncbi:putative methyltransferase-domain-containing protein [Zopfochytrium polystomum]|nr:putative methyltransferase-domain-containing protein [Zopfochytrium polystomum]